MELHDVCPGSTEITTADGRKWQLGPLKLKILAELERRFREDCADPISAGVKLAQQLTDGDQAKHVLGLAWSAALRGSHVDRALFGDWTDNGAGWKLAYILRLQQNHKNLSEPECEDIINDWLATVATELKAAEEKKRADSGNA